MNTPFVTIALCTYNRAEFLRRALASLVAQQLSAARPFEVVIVDNASTDDTPRVAAEVAASAAVPVRIACESRQGVAFARNRSVAEARGEWIAFFDDDQVAEPTWLSELLDAAEKQNVRVVGGAVRLQLDDQSLAALPAVCRLMLGETVGRDAAQPYTASFAPGTGNLLVHRSVFNTIGVFDTALTEAGEDTDLYRRIRAAGIKAWYTPTAVARHAVPAYRLDDRYWRWRMLRFGGQLARRDRAERGRLFFPLVVPARTLHAALVQWPKCIAARLWQSPQQQLAARCMLWRSEGYLRFALAWLAPRLFAQRAFFSSLEFRVEREALGAS